MKASVQTRVIVAMTENEARSAIADPLDVVLALRSALQQLDGIPIVELIAQQRTRGKLLAPPTEKDKVQKRKKISRKECPHCHELVGATGYPRHVAACAKKHIELDTVLEIQHAATG
jgi:hypothetical protein